MDYWKLGVPVLFVCSGVVTFVAIFIACIYTSRNSRAKSESQANTGKIKTTNTETNSETLNKDKKSTSTEGQEVDPCGFAKFLEEKIKEASSQSGGKGDKKSENEESEDGNPHEWQTDLSMAAGAGCPFSAMAEKMNKEEAEREIDPVEYCQHIPREVKRKQQQVVVDQVQKNMTDEDRAKENDIQRQQLEEIFRLMETQQDKFGLNRIDDINEQMKLYM